MKRKTASKALSLLLTLCMVMSLFAGTTVTASAADGATTLYVNGVDMLSESSTAPDGVSYDKSTNTLTLENAALQQFHTDTVNTDYDWKYAAVIYAVGGDLTIQLIGENRITYNDASEKMQCICGIYFNNVNLTITGTGTLAIQNTATQRKANYYKDICGEENSSLTIDGTKVECVADSAAKTLTDQVCGISLSKGALKVHNGQLTVRTRNTTSTAYGIELFGNEPHILNGNSQITAVEGTDGVKKSSGFCGICCFSTIQLGAGAKLYASGAEMAISENESSITAADGAKLSVKGNLEYNKASSELTEIQISDNTIKANDVKDYKTIEVTASASTSAAATFTDGFGNTIENAASYEKGTTTNAKDYTFAGWFDEQGNELASAADAVAGKTYTAKWKKNGKTVRTMMLHLSTTETTNKAAEEGWSWDANTKTLMLSGCTIDVQYSPAVELPPDGATITTAADTQNTLSNCSCPDAAIHGEGALTINGSGSLTVIGDVGGGLFVEGNLAINAPISVTTPAEMANPAILGGSITIDSSLSITTPTGGKVGSAGGRQESIVGSDDFPAAQVVIGAAAPTFNDGFGKTDCTFGTYTKGDTNTKGYTFAGWFGDDGQELTSADAAVAGTTYTARWTKNGKTVRTTALDLTKISQDNTFGAVLQGSVYTNSAEGWTWDSDKNILTLANVTMDITLSEGTTDTAAVRLPDGAILATAPGTDNNVTVNNNRACAIVGAGTLTIPAAETGKLTVVGGMSGICAKDIIINIPISVSAEGVAVYTEDKGTITIASGLEIKSPIGGKIVASEDASAIYEEDGTTPAKNVVIGIAKKYTVIYNTNGGSAVAPVTGLSYGASVAKPAEDPTKEGYSFAGWYSDEACTKAWNFASGKVEDNLTLYAKWSKDPVYDVTGKVTEAGNDLSGATVELKRGSEVIASTVTNDDGNYSFNGVLSGDYNIVVTKDDGKTKTAHVTITDANATVNVDLPGKSVSSVVKVVEDETVVYEKMDPTKTLVAGVDKIAEAASPAAGQHIEIKLDVTPKADVTESDNADHAALKEEQNDIKEEASGKKLEFLDLSLTETVTEGGNDTYTDIGDDNTVLLTITIPFDTTSAKNIVVYRHHGGSAAAMDENPETGNEGFKVGNGEIVIYSKSFSTYAIGYTTPSHSGGGSYTPSYSVTGPDTENGKVTLSSKYPAGGSTVKVTVTPDEGYELDTLKVTDSKGNEIALTDNGDGTYTFKMPYGSVTVNATFRKIACAKDATCPISSFTDASATAWYHDGVHYCIDNGLMTGYGNGVFKPNADTTRAMITVMLWRLNGSPVVNYLLDFEDVEEGQWYTEAIRWAKSEGIATGYGNGYFGTNDAITREQMVTILWRYAQYKGIDVSVGEDTNILSYNDAFDVAEYAIPAMQWACGSGMVQGMNDPDGEGMILAPGSKGTRAQIATMMMRFCTEIIK